MPFGPAMVVHIVLRPIALRPKKNVKKKTCCFLLGVSVTENNVEQNASTKSVIYIIESHEV